MGELCRDGQKLWVQSENRQRILIYCTAFKLHGTMCQKVPESNPRLTVSEGTCPPLCLRGGLGRTRVTWWRGRPCVGSSDRPSQDAERDSGEEYDGTEGGGEELESSQRPGSSEEPWKDCRGWEKWEGEDTVKVSRRGNQREPSFLSTLIQSVTALTHNDLYTL